MNSGATTSFWNFVKAYQDQTDRQFEKVGRASMALQDLSHIPLFKSLIEQFQSVKEDIERQDTWKGVIDCIEKRYPFRMLNQAEIRHLQQHQTYLKTFKRFGRQLSTRFFHAVSTFQQGFNLSDKVRSYSRKRALDVLKETNALDDDSDLDALLKTKRQRTGVPPDYGMEDSDSDSQVSDSEDDD